MSRFIEAIALIDDANAADPNAIDAGGLMRPAELVYGERMSATLAGYSPDASELLRLAARAQHIQRWRVPRSDYPMDRAGYHLWRNDLKRKHAEWAGEILARSGYSDSEIARCGALIRKENLKGDAEAQTLEDVACLVFLEHYSADFAAKHDEAKIVAILRKTWSKMSEPGRNAALGLPLVPGVRTMIGRALETEKPSS